MSSEKNQKPTPRRLEDARRRGEVVFSPDIASTATFVLVVVGLWLLSGMAISMIAELWRHATSPALFSRPDDRFQELLIHASQVLLISGVVIMGVAAVGGLLGSFFQVGGLLAFSRILPDVNRLNPAEGLKRIFSTRSLIQLLKMVLKTLLLSALMFIVVRTFLDSALKMGYVNPAVVLAASGRILLTIFGWASLIYAIMAAVDYAHEHFEFIKRHRMSIEDVRRDYKEAQGDPTTTSRRRGVHFEAVYASLGDRVRAASAVIYSERTAVALQYLGEKDLPRVIARGENEIAGQIRRFAQEALIPMEHDAALAGRLFDEVPQDRHIPRSLYAPVARLLRWAQGQDS